MERGQHRRQDNDQQRGAVSLTGPPHRLGITREKAEKGATLGKTKLESESVGVGAHGRSEVPWRSVWTSLSVSFIFSAGEAVVDYSWFG